MQECSRGGEVASGGQGAQAFSCLGLLGLSWQKGPRRTRGVSSIVPGLCWGTSQLRGPWEFLNSPLPTRPTIGPPDSGLSPAQRASSGQTSRDSFLWPTPTRRTPPLHREHTEETPHRATSDYFVYMTWQDIGTPAKEPGTPPRTCPGQLPTSQPSEG